MKTNPTLSDLAQKKNGPAQRAATGGQSAAPQERQEPKINPEIDQKIDKFIGENPKLFEYYNGLSKERLVRAQMLNRANEAERKVKIAARQVEGLQKWVADRPEIAAKIEAKLANVPDDKKIGAFVNVARREQQALGASLPAPGQKPAPAPRQSM
jgi:hypothetical protein